MRVPITKAQKSAEGCLVLLLWQVEASLDAMQRIMLQQRVTQPQTSRMPRLTPSRCSDKESICQGGDTGSILAWEESMCHKATKPGGQNSEPHPRTCVPSY